MSYIYRIASMERLKGEVGKIFQAKAMSIVEELKARKGRPSRTSSL